VGYYSYYGFQPYVSAAERRHKAEREMQKLRKKGHPVSPVVIEGRAIACTFWGKAWCENLERYSDYENRLPRGRTYVRNGSVLDLQIAPGEVRALVSGSRIYEVAVKVASLPRARWASICSDSAGAIDSLVELIQGRFSRGVMERICREKSGLFPAPAEIEFSCSCPDWASLCKHVAAVLYGVGARLDEKPELLFRLRKVDEKDLIARAGKGLQLSKKGPAMGKVLATDDISELFGLEMGQADDEYPLEASPASSTPRRTRRAARSRSETAAIAAPAKRAARRSSTSTPKKKRIRKAGMKKRTSKGKRAKRRP